MKGWNEIRIVPWKYCETGLCVRADKGSHMSVATPFRYYIAYR